MRERLDLMLAPVIVRILAGAIRRFRHVGAAPKDAPSVHVNEGRYLRACPRPGDGPSQLRKRPPPPRGRWIVQEACRAGAKPSGEASRRQGRPAKRRAVRGEPNLRDRGNPSHHESTPALETRRTSQEATIS